MVADKPKREIKNSHPSKAAPVRNPLWRRRDVAVLFVLINYLMLWLVSVSQPNDCMTTQRLPKQSQSQLLCDSPELTILPETKTILSFVCNWEYSIEFQHYSMLIIQKGCEWWRLWTVSQHIITLIRQYIASIEPELERISTKYLKREMSHGYLLL